MKAIKLTLVCMFLTVFAFANVSTSEKDALISLYNSTQGNQWNTSWNLWEISGRAVFAKWELRLHAGLAGCWSEERIPQTLERNIPRAFQQERPN